MDEDEIVAEQVEQIEALREELLAVVVAGVAPEEVAELKAIARRGIAVLRDLGEMAPSWRERHDELIDAAVSTAADAVRQAKTLDGRPYWAQLERAHSALVRAEQYSEAADFAPEPLAAAKHFMGYAKQAEDAGDEQAVALYAVRDHLRLAEDAADDDGPEAA